MDRTKVAQLITDVFAEIMETDPGQISEGMSITHDVGAESLEIIQIVEEIERRLGEKGIKVRIEDAELENIMTVRDAVELVAELIRQAPDGETLSRLL
jgi:acyl carrier protein